MNRSTFIQFALLFAGAAAWSQTPTVIPLFDCWTQRPLSDPAGSDTVTLFYGYNNISTSPVQTFIREDYFIPFPNRRGQPFVYEPGEHHKVFAFEVKLIETPATWFLRDATLAIGRDQLLASNRCSGNHFCWDINNNGMCDAATEDTNGDGACTAHDCRGLQGPRGDTGYPACRDPRDPPDSSDPKALPASRRNCVSPARHPPRHPLPLPAPPPRSSSPGEAVAQFPTGPTPAWPAVSPTASTAGKSPAVPDAPAPSPSAT